MAQISEVGLVLKEHTNRKQYRLYRGIYSVTILFAFIVILRRTVYLIIAVRRHDSSVEVSCLL
ncbi:hypothetical protein ALC53_06789 [Atta colombica]|uniref:Uncharacterized protein n=1 Tax=Atta colombica TaxID=520822 RepID=A0A195BEM5_9HYME|nr:hypothetical protein ALC53_06789 [Atta colombica]